MKTLSELQANRKNNIGLNHEIPEAILLKAEEAYEAGRQSYKYAAGETYKEQSLYWERCCPFVHMAFVSAENKAYNIELTFIEDRVR